MLAYSSRPPDPAIVGERWRTMWLDRLKHEPLLAIPWLQHPHRDAYWKHGSVCEDIGAIEAAVLAVGGWNDAYTNAVSQLVDTVQAPVKGIVGPWAHKYPHFAVPEPRIGFLQESLRWWDRWLKDIPTGVESDPAHRTYIMDLQPPGGSISQVPGRWVADKAFASSSSPASLARFAASHIGQGLPIVVGQICCSSRTPTFLCSHFLRPGIRI
jgi:predicted acyl esterase